MIAPRGLSDNCLLTVHTISMISTSVAKPSKLRFSVHRARLRAQGLRPTQIWVPDVQMSALKASAHPQSLAVPASLQAHQDQDFIDAISDWGDELSGAKSGPFLAARITRVSLVPLSSFKMIGPTPQTPSHSASSPRTQLTRRCCASSSFRTHKPACRRALARWWTRSTRLANPNGPTHWSD